MGKPFLGSLVHDFLALAFFHGPVFMHLLDSWVKTARTVCNELCCLCPHIQIRISKRGVGATVGMRFTGTQVSAGTFLLKAYCPYTLHSSIRRGKTVTANILDRQLLQITNEATCAVYKRNRNYSATAFIMAFTSQSVVHCSTIVRWQKARSRRLLAALHDLVHEPFSQAGFQYSQLCERNSQSLPAEQAIELKEPCRT
jgi:hypothetical protein